MFSLSESCFRVYTFYCISVVAVSNTALVMIQKYIPFGGVKLLHGSDCGKVNDAFLSSPPCMCESFCYFICGYVYSL